MQLYAGLPIITNKMTPEEQEGIPHHLLGCIGLQEPTWVVGTFVKRALEVIEEIRGRGRLPILVGGTHYYTQSLLFRDWLAQEDGDETKREEHEDGKEEFAILQQPTETLLAELQKVDPVMAARWHPNDRRKIQRSLEIYLRTGRTASETYAEQQRHTRNAEPNASQDVESNARHNLRFPTLLFWVHAEHSTLRKRLDSRVDKMLEDGLLNEVRALNAFADTEAAAGRPVNETRGIWASIGYKEFKEYTSALQAGSTVDKELQMLKVAALDRTKAATRQYAKRQLRWIRIKLLNALSAADRAQSMYLLDGSDVSAFEDTVLEPAIRVTDAFLTAAQHMPDPASLSSAAAAELSGKPTKTGRASDVNWTKQHCDVCDVSCVIEAQWMQHIGSSAHKKKVSKKRQLNATILDPPTTPLPPPDHAGDHPAD